MIAFPSDSPEDSDEEREQARLERDLADIPTGTTQTGKEEVRGRPRKDGQPPKRTRRPPLNLAEVEHALRTAHGLVSYASRILKINDIRLYQLINKHPRLKQICELARHSMVDTAELALRQAATSREGWAVSLIMRSPVARPRGYADAPNAAAQIAIVNNPLNGISPNGFASATPGLPGPNSVPIQDLIATIAAQPDYLEYAQHRASQQCQSLDADPSALKPLLGASLIGGNSGVSSGNSEPG
jgi:hypothetical protein